MRASLYILASFAALGLLSGCASGPQADSSATVSPSDTPVCQSRDVISNSAQLSQLIEQASMQMAPVLTFTAKGNIDQIVKNSRWSSYSKTYRYSLEGGGKVRLTLEFADASRILAAHRTPALIGRLSSAEKKALEKARDITRQCLVPGNRFDTIVRLHDYLIHNSDTVLDDSAAKTVDLLLRGRGDCWVYSQTMYLLLQMAGINNYVVTGVANGTEHAWNIVQLNKDEWYHIDTTWDDPIIRNTGYGGLPSHRYFLLCDYHLGLDHEWKKAPYPKSSTRHATYFRERRIYFTDYREFWAHAIHAYHNGELQFEGWLDFCYRKEDFKAGMLQAMQQEPRLRSCGWVAPKEGNEGALRVVFR